MVQYSAKPLGKVNAKKASIRGIIQSIMLLVEACLGSVLGMVVIFCCTQVETPTNKGKIDVGSGLARSNHRKLLFRGTDPSARGFQEYNLWDSPIRWLGVVPKLFSRAWYNPTHMGSWIIMGPKHPRGFIPSCLYNAIMALERPEESLE